MTLKRIISALSLLVIFSFSFFNSNEIYFNSFALIICLIGMFELNGMLFKYKHPMYFILTLVFLGLAFFSLLFWAEETVEEGPPITASDLPSEETVSGGFCFLSSESQKHSVRFS